MLKRSTWIWLAIALGTGFSVIAYDQVSRQKEERQTQQNLVLGLEETDIQSFVIKTGQGKKKKTLTFTRPEAEAAPTQWQVSTGKGDPLQASDGAIAFLMNLVQTGEADSQLQATQKQLKEYGLDKPRATLVLTLATGDTQELQLGAAGFDDQFVYASIKPDPTGTPKASPTPTKATDKTGEMGETDKDKTDKTGEQNDDTAPQPKTGKTSEASDGAGKTIQTIPKDFEYALIREMNEWVYTPPDASPDPTESPSPGELTPPTASPSP